MKQKTNRLHFSTRTIAMVLSVIMLIGSIATGSMLSTFAAYLKDAAANSDAVSQAASEGSDIAKSAIPSQNADTAAQADNEEDKPDLSGFEENEIVRGLKDDLADTGANIVLAETGYDKWYVRGSWDQDGNSVWKDHEISTTRSYSVSLEAGTDYQFVFKGNNDQFSANTTISGTTDYNFSRNDSDSITLHTTIAGTYTFKFKGMDGGGTAMQTRIEFPVDTTPDTWTVAGGTGGQTGGGQADNLFTSTWDTTLTQNDMTNTSGTTWTWTKSNVTLPAGNILCKVVKNHAWDTAYPSSNQSYNIATAGDYNVTITFDSSSHDVTITATAAAKSTLSVQNNIANAVVTATYNGTTVGEGQSISNVPQGASVSISVTPDSGYQCTAVTGTYNTNSTVSGTGSGNSWTLEMPAANTTVSVTLGTVTMKKIYFNNNYTQYGTVYAYVYDKDGTNHTYEYLGKRPGKVMQEAENSEIWYIEVPEDVQYVEFISGDGKTTGEMKIPWPNSGESSTYTYPKYTAPYNYDAPTIANGGTWGNYIWGSTNKRGNEYTVSKGSTMDADNLFTGITATLYDYYTDGEITKNAGTATDTTTSSGWIGGIASDEYSSGTNASGWEWDPYTKLNSALSSYANNTAEPKYAVTRPLYFGNLNDKDGGSALVSSYYNFVRNANNSIDLNPNTTAVTGLSGKSLAGSSIHYYKSGATDENGAPMAMFDEDFLSGENSQNKPLASILRTAAFPVRKTVEGGTVSSVSKLYLVPGDWTNDGAVFDAYFFNDSGFKSWVAFPDSGDSRGVDIPSSATKVIFVRRDPAGGGHRTDWNNKWAQTGDITLAKTGTNAKNVYTFSSWDANFTASLDTSKDGVNFTGGHDYYTFNSTGGRDNAYIRNINKSSKTAQIDYYANDAAWSGGTTNNTQGFFPFDYDNKGQLAKDLGFGMKLTIPFTLNGSGANNGKNSDGTAQTFDFSGDDDLWVFVDGKLVLDLGGAHARTTGSINFQTKTVTAANQQSIASGITRNSSFASGFNTNENYVHTMTIYYMERGMFESNLQFGFSFHAIPNQFWIDKKIRTKDKYGLGYDTINSGFFTSNNQSGDASNMTTYTLGDKTTSMTKFEKSYQGEEFTVTQWYGSNGATPTTLASGKNYTIDYDENTHQTGSDGQYPIYHDLGNAFIGQFTKGDKFKLKETISNSNKYVYTPVFSVWDQANNDKEITASGDNTNGYTFDFSPTTTVTTGIENTNIKARFDNYMSAHDLVLKKELTNATDTSTTFDFQILFDFDGTGYVSYPLYYTHSDGTRAQLSDSGTVSLTAGESITIDKIPDKANVKVVEILPKSVSGYRYDSMTVKNGTANLTNTAVSSVETSTITKGATFTTSDNTTYVTFSNKKPDNRYTIKYIYPSYDNLYGNQSYTVSGVFSEKDLTSYLKLDDSGNLQFKSPELKKNFINSKSPYENNFMQAVSFADATIDDDSEGKGWVNGNYIADATAATTNEKISVYFYLPYDVDSETTLIPQESGSSGKVAMIANKAVGSKKIDCFDWYVTWGATKRTNEWKPENTTFVNAPLMIYENVNNENTVQYFQYWSVKKLSGYGMKAAEYTRCYDYQFNLSLFMDCYIEPVYASTWAQTDNPNPPQTYKSYERFDPELQITGDTTKGISVTFLENSRNQYNQNGKGQRNTTNTAMDVIYSDFLLSFNKVDGITQLNTLDANTKKAGLVIEAVDYLSGNNTDGFNASIDYSKESKYNSNEASSKSTIESWLKGGSKGNLSVQKAEFDVRSLDNKNCLQYYYSFNNRACNNDTQELLNTTQNRYKVFRAYSYIGDVSGNTLTNVTLSQPIYFTIYDIGKLYDLADNATGK